ncbi:MAG: hypothetical protein AAB019_11205 [Planctomycetota bacterium]
MLNKHQKYYEALAAEEKMLITLRDELYGGSWDRMLKDLNDRLKGRPYIFKLVNRIKDDIKRIERLRDYENKNDINLADYMRGE